VPIEALTELAWPAVPAAPMGQGEVFTDGQVARADGGYDLNGFDIQAETGEEAVAGHAATDAFAAEQVSGAESAGARYVAEEEQSAADSLGRCAGRGDRRIRGSADLCAGRAIA